MWSKKILYCFLVTFLLFGLVACGTGEVTEEGATEEPSKAEEEATKEPTKEVTEVVEIEFYFPESYGAVEAFEAVIEAFEEEYPSIKVKTRVATWADFKPSLPIMWASDNVADVVNTGGPDIQEYAYYGAIMPLDDIFPEEEWDQYNSSVLQEVVYDGKVYGAPWNDSAIAFYYNKDMFEAADIEAPQTLEEAWTWEEWLSNIQEIVKVAEEEQGEKVWGLVSLNNPPYGDYWTMWIPRSAGEKGSNTYKGISDDGTKLSGYLDTPEAISALKFYQSLFQEYELMPTDEVPDAFGNEKAACYMGFTSLGLNMEQTYPDLNWGVMPLPYFVTPITHTGGFSPSISAKSKHPEEAKIFLEYLTKGEGLMIYSEHKAVLPAKLDVRDDIPWLVEGYAQMFVDLNLEWGEPRPPSPGHAIYNNIIGVDMIKDIALGADVEETVASAIQEAEAKLAKFER